MAVKGKKKSQSRGSQGKRRPAAAPRGAYAARPHTAWYRTMAGRVIAALVLVIVLAAITAVVQARSNPGDLTGRQNALDQYTGDVRALLQAITPPAVAEDGVPNKLSARSAGALKKKSARWVTQLGKAQQTLSQMAPPTPATQNATIMFLESVQLYTQAANIYKLAPATSPPAQVKILASGASLRDQATALWQQGTNMLDQARSAAQMSPSQLRIPTAGAVAPATPTPASSPQTAPTSSGGNNKAGSKNKAGGKSSK
ncbi:MAG: hypothetical protein M3P18_02130 [Actinomycetota bacterium]|nr:hypothetical protein [Actinomycetota bacterium]